MREQAVSLLVAAHREFLGFLEKRVESREVAEDILQAAFVKGLERGAEVQDEKVVAWFYRVLRNAVTDHYRHRAVSSRAMSAWTRDFAETAVAAEVRQGICGCISTSREHARATDAFDPRDRSVACSWTIGGAGLAPARALLAGLKPEYGQALQIVDVQEGKLSDLAAQAGITAENAAVRIHRARKALRAQVEKACGTCSDHGCFDCTCKGSAMN